MIKKYKKTIIITSLLTLVPSVIGLILWNQLPEKIATHFNINNEPDAYSGKAFAVFALPALMLVFHLICCFASSHDPKGKNYTDKMMKIVLGICPAVSILTCSTVYLHALGKGVKMGFVASLLVGIMFIIVGNYLPKCKQTYTMGIKLPWTLDDEENWNKTHRLAGKLWFIGGVIICATAVLSNFFILMTVTLVKCIVPTVYSYNLYRKSHSNS